MHGRSVIQEKPVYLEEIAVLQALRVLDDSVKLEEMKLFKADQIRIYAGDHLTVKRIRQRFLEGALELESPAAAAIAGDIRQLGSWVNAERILRPSGPQEGFGSPTMLQWSRKEILRLVEDFRALALSA